MSCVLSYVSRVSCCQGRIPWDPHTMWRATKATERNSNMEGRVKVQDCGDWHVIDEIKAMTFFKG